MKKMMKYFFVAAGTILAGISCTANFEEINTNPNALVTGSVQARNMFEPLLYDGAKTWDYYTFYWNNQLMQYAGFTGTTREEHRYKIGDQDNNAWYTNFLGRWANNAHEMLTLARGEENAIFEAIALTLQAFYISNITDMFGDIICSEAFQGREGLIFPKYDTQQEVYEQIFEWLEAANEIYATGVNFLTSEASLDIMYSGSGAAWQKFNNSLYLRLLTRVSGRTVMGSAAKIREIYENPSLYPIFESNADNASVKFTGTAPYINYFEAQGFNDNGFTNERRVAAQLIKMTVLTDASGAVFEDPRLRIWCKKDGNNNWKGTVGGGSGAEWSANNSGTSKFNTGAFVRGDRAYVFMDYAEVEFIFAEAALKGWISGGVTAAKEHYEAAIRASIEKWGEEAPYAELSNDNVAPDVSEGRVADFLALPAVYFDENYSESILTGLIGDQKYLALFWIGMEAWHECRRTGYPVLEIGNGASYNDFQLPKRFAYVVSAVGSNPTEAAIAIARIKGSDDMLQPVWWSREAIETGYYD